MRNVATRFLIALARIGIAKGERLKHLVESLRISINLITIEPTFPSVHHIQRVNSLIGEVHRHITNFLTNQDLVFHLHVAAAHVGNHVLEGAVGGVEVHVDGAVHLHCVLHLHRGGAQGDAVHHNLIAVAINSGRAHGRVHIVHVLQHMAVQFERQGDGLREHLLVVKHRVLVGNGDALVGFQGQLAILSYNC